ncbi:nucleoporin NDC1-like [Clytia hemisphaerica]|uniref:Nucleoporin NDC1 n=1 Tax=Clytia hemisphaerica TaxID=252671 RepID=A0A7M5XFP0_9CNID
MASQQKTDISTEEFSWRSFACGIWMLIVVPPSICMYLMLSNFSLWSPLAMFSGTLSTIFSLKALVICMLLQVTSLISITAHKRLIHVHSQIRKSSLLMHILRPNQLLTIIYFNLCTILFTLVLSCIQDSIDSAYWSRSFMVSLSLFIGSFYGINYFTDERYKVKFPTIQQKKLFQIKKIILPSLKESLAMSMNALKIFIPLHIASNVLPKSLLLLFTDFSYSGSLLANSILLFCDVSMIWSCLLTSTLVLFVLIFSNNLLHVFYSQHLQLPLDAMLLENQGKTLSDCMVHPNIILKHLAFMDFCFISKLEGSRRSKMFELSLPGNQPHLWNKSSLQCLQEFEKQRMSIQNECEHKEMGKRQQQQQLPAPKNLASQELFSPVKNATTSVSSPDFNSKIQTNIVNSQQNIQRGRLFENLQIIIWAIEGLCNLVACSLTEDTYGVVQKTVPSIVSELLSLLESCETFTKLTVTQQAISNDTKSMELSQKEMVDATSLKIALKSGLYTITSTFKHHTTALRLSGEHKKRLLAFLEYDE